MDERTHLQIGASTVNGVVLLGLTGELDLASAIALADAIGGAASHDADVVIVDLRALE